MTRLVNPNRVNGSLHNLSRLQGLSDEACNLLLVSDQTLYILANLADEDVYFSSRYYEDYPNTNQVLVYTDSSPQAPEIRRIADNFNIQVIGGNMALEDALNNIASAIIAASCCNGGSAGSGTGGADGTETAPSGDIDNGVNPPSGSDFPDYDAYQEYKCNVANAIVDDIDSSVNSLRSIAWGSVLALPAAEIILLLAATIATPIPGDEIIAAAAVLAVWGGAFEPLFNDLEAAIDADREELVCALFNAGDVGQAKDQFATALDAAIDAEVADGLARYTIKGIARMFHSHDLLNKLFTQETGINFPVGSVLCHNCLPEVVSVKFTLGINGLPRGSGDLSKNGSQRTVSSSEDSNGFHYIGFGVYLDPDQATYFNDCSPLPPGVAGTSDEQFAWVYNAVNGTIIQAYGALCSNGSHSLVFNPNLPTLGQSVTLTAFEAIGSAPFTMDIIIA